MLQDHYNHFYTRIWMLDPHLYKLAWDGNYEFLWHSGQLYNQSYHHLHIHHYIRSLIIGRHLYMLHTQHSYPFQWCIRQLHSKLPGKSTQSALGSHVFKALIDVSTCTIFLFVELIEAFTFESTIFIHTRWWRKITRCFIKTFIDIDTRVITMHGVSDLHSHVKDPRLLKHSDFGTYIHSSISWHRKPFTSQPYFDDLTKSIRQYQHTCHQVFRSP